MSAWIINVYIEVLHIYCFYINTMRMSMKDYPYINIWILIPTIFLAVHLMRADTL